MNTSQSVSGIKRYCDDLKLREYHTRLRASSEIEQRRAEQPKRHPRAKTKRRRNPIRPRAARIRELLRPDLHLGMVKNQIAMEKAGTLA